MVTRGIIKANGQIRRMRHTCVRIDVSNLADACSFGAEHHRGQRESSVGSFPASVISRVVNETFEFVREVVNWCDRSVQEIVLGPSSETFRHPAPRVAQCAESVLSRQVVDALLGGE